MKRILLTATALMIAAGAASAMTSSSELTASEKHEIKRFVPNADLDGLTVADVHAIQAAIYGGNENRGGQIRAILN